MAPRRDNQKAIEARERKALQNQTKKEAELAAKEDAKWRDEGTKVLRNKETRKAEADAKADDARRRREERAALERAEAESFQGTTKGAGGKKAASGKKVTQYQLLQRQLLLQKTAQTASTSAMSPMARVVSADSLDLLVENVNHARREEAYNALIAGDSLVDASGIDAALEQLSSADPADRKIDMHPERRAKAAYKAYEARELETMKSELPGLKRSQYIERIQKAWTKSPENPLNKI